MKSIITLLVSVSCLGIGTAAEPVAQPAPTVSLFFVHEKMPDGGIEVATPSKSSKGFIAGRPDLDLPVFMDVVHLAPKVLKKAADGKMVLVDGDADLLLNLHINETNKLELLHKKFGDCKLYVRVVVGNTTRYFDAEFAPISDDTVFIEGTAAEKTELAGLLRRLIGKPPKGEAVAPNGP